MEKEIVFIDDERTMPIGFTKIFRTGESFIEWIKENPKVEIELSLDHDLGWGIDGYEICKQLANIPNNIIYFQFHTANPVGWDNMFNFIYFGHNRHGLFPNLKYVNTYQIVYNEKHNEYDRSKFEKYI